MKKLLLIMAILSLTLMDGAHVSGDPYAPKNLTTLSGGKVISVVTGISTDGKERFLRDGKGGYSFTGHLPVRPYSKFELNEYFKNASLEQVLRDLDSKVNAQSALRASVFGHSLEFKSDAHAIAYIISHVAAKFGVQHVTPDMIQQLSSAQRISYADFRSRGSEVKAKLNIALMAYIYQETEMDDMFKKNFLSYLCTLTSYILPKEYVRVFDFGSRKEGEKGTVTFTAADGTQIVREGVVHYLVPGKDNTIEIVPPGETYSRFDSIELYDLGDEGVLKGWADEVVHNYFQGFYTTWDALRMAYPSSLEAEAVYGSGEMRPPHSSDLSKFVVGDTAPNAFSDYYVLVKQDDGTYSFPSDDMLEFAKSAALRVNAFAALVRIPNLHDAKKLLSGGYITNTRVKQSSTGQIMVNAGGSWLSIAPSVFQMMP